MIESLHLDTSIVATWARRRNTPLVARLEATDPRSLQISFVVEAELRVGILKDPSYAAARRALRFLESIEVIQSRSETVVAYAHVRASLERIGMRIGDNDLWIAATALAEDATLVTLNTREFARVEGLRFEDWQG